MIELLFVIIGIASGLVVGLLFSKFGIGLRRLPYAIVIALATALYPILQSAETPAEWQSFWWISLALFAVPAVLGLFRSPWWIAVGLILHALFDAVLGLAGVSQYVCPFYAPWCAGFDIALGVLFIFRVCVTPESRVSTGR